jgi:hypothetical protein
MGVPRCRHSLPASFVFCSTGVPWSMHMMRTGRMTAGKEEDWLIGSKRAERGKVRCGHEVPNAYHFLLQDGGFEGGGVDGDAAEPSADRCSITT